MQSTQKKTPPFLPGNKQGEEHTAESLYQAEKDIGVEPDLDEGELARLEGKD